MADARRFDRSFTKVDRSTDDFLTSLARELRDPLHPLQCSLDLIHHYGAAVPAEIREIAQRQVDHLCRVIERLDVARPSINAGPMNLVTPAAANENLSDETGVIPQIPPAFAR